MTTHVKVLAGLGLLCGTLGLAGAVFSSLFFGALATLVGSSQDEHAAVGRAVLGLTGLAFTMFLIVTSSVSLVCAWGLLKLRPWARIVGIILAAICLIQFPLGTIIGAYALWVLFNKKTEALFIK